MLGLAGLLSCGQGTEPVSQLDPVRITGMRLTLLDPSLGTRGVFLEFAPADSGPITSFEVYRSSHPDSLGAPFIRNLPGHLRQTMVALPDSSPPFQVYFGVRAIRRLETGENLFSGAIPIDSLELLIPPRIYHPANGDSLVGPGMKVEVGLASDQGMVLRQMWWEREDGAWSKKLDTCLPYSDCNTPAFGNTVIHDSIFLAQSSRASNTGLLCVLGSEVFDGRLTAQRQTMACTRFERILP